MSAKTVFSFYKINKRLGRICLVMLCLLVFSGKAWSQQRDTSDKMLISIDRAQSIEGFKTDSGEYRKFIGDVILRQGTDTLYCDSAIQNSTTKNFEAFGNVKIAQLGGTKGTSDYLKYTSDKKLALMHGNVTLTDGKNTLECEDLTYDLGSKTGVYDNWGKLKNDTTTVTSKRGIYSVNEKIAHFIGTVYITDPQYKINSEDLEYNTETKVTTFFAKSKVIRDSGRSVLQTSHGWYDGLNSNASFWGWSSVWYDAQYIEADSLKYDKRMGHALANGHVISIDTGHHATIYCGHLEYFQKKRVLWATMNPVLVQANGKDTLYINADTFYSAPMEKWQQGGLRSQIPNDTMSIGDSSGAAGSSGTVKTDVPPVAPPVKKVAAADTTKWVLPGVQEKKSTKKSKKDSKKEIKGELKIAADTTSADTTAPLYFIGYHHVLIFSDSLQGKCDSVCYTRSDSMIRMIYDPVAWAHNSQITGDTILLQLDSSTLRRMYVPNNALIVSQSGPAKAKMFDQIQGRTLTAYFDKKAITKMVVYPNAECIYFEKDEKGAYMGVSQANSTRMQIFFNDQKIRKIKFEQDWHHTGTPMDKADFPAMRLSRFKWIMDQRPKSKEELFRNSLEK